MTRAADGYSNSTRAAADSLIDRDTTIKICILLADVVELGMCHLRYTPKHALCYCLFAGASRGAKQTQSRPQMETD